MKTTELRSKTLDELKVLLSEKTTEQVENLRSLAAGELTNPRVIRKGRREIAQLKTVIAEQIRDSNNKKESKDV